MIRKRGFNSVNKLVGKQAYNVFIHLKAYNILYIFIYLDFNQEE